MFQRQVVQARENGRLPMGAEKHPLVAHRRQLLIGPEFIPVRGDWMSHRIASGIVLSSDPDLRVQELRSQDGVRYLLLGHAVLSDRRGEVHQALAETPSARIEDFTTALSGSNKGR